MAQTTALPSHAPLVSQLARATSFTEIGFRIPQQFQHIPTYPMLSKLIRTYPNLSKHFRTYPNMCEPI